MTDLKKNYAIGIWGYGIVGQAAARFFYKRGIPFAVMDKNSAIKDLVAQNFTDVPFFNESESKAFFNAVDTILPSPGVDIRFHYASIKSKLTTELDIFFTELQKPIVAITGTIGKTSITHFLSSLLQEYRIPIATGGNIGIPTLDLLDNKTAHYAILELSSFQLEYIAQFVPDLAIWTNFHPNHLDRHASPEEYFAAKYQLIALQTNSQRALLPVTLIPWLERFGYPQSTLYFFSTHYNKLLHDLSYKHPVFTCKDQKISVITKGDVLPLVDSATLPKTTFLENWLVIVSTLHLLNMPLDEVPAYAQKILGVEHRLEKVAVINNIIFYNDSKSTTIASTLSAVKELADKRIILLLGGLSKGVDRTPLIHALPAHVKHVAIFGKEKDELQQMCWDTQKASSAHSTLEMCLEYAKKIAVPGDVILLSPAGSSYDLFANYEERGRRFKELVLTGK
jgi:UDP-N-acetylmuramoylalanine--D-glutamate ligase